MIAAGAIDLGAAFRRAAPFISGRLETTATGQKQTAGAVLA